VRAGEKEGVKRGEKNQNEKDKGKRARDGER
jgi:hypothetical protein